MIFYHGTTEHKAARIMNSGLRARFYEPEWFTISEERSLAEYHAKLRNGGRTPAVIRVVIPKNKLRNFIYVAGGLKKPIPTEYLEWVRC